jgi:hypothetical protein
MAEDFDPNQYVEMLAKEWNHLAPTAYSQFRKTGRGAFYVDFSGTEAGSGEINMLFQWVPANDLKWLEPFLDERTINLMNTYNPDEMVLFLVRRRADAIATIFIGAEGARRGPKQIHDENKERPIH